MALDNPGYNAGMLWAVYSGHEQMCFTPNHITQDIDDSQYMNMAVEMDDRSQPPSKLYYNVASTIRLRLSAT